MLEFNYLGVCDHCGDPNAFTHRFFNEFICEYCWDKQWKVTLDKEFTDDEIAQIIQEQRYRLIGNE